MKHGRLLHLGGEAALQLVRLEAQQETHGDGAQGHQQTQSHGEALARGLGGALARRFTLLHRLVACTIHDLLLD